VPFPVTRRRLDGFLAIALFIAATAIGTWRATATVLDWDLYSQYYGPAVLGACGHGFGAPAEAEVTGALQAFLSREEDRFDCTSLPSTVLKQPLNIFQEATRYALVAIAVTWSVAGVEWSALAPYLGLLFGLSILLSYATLRLGTGPLMAAFLTGLVITWSPYLRFLTVFRDFSKVPFTIACLAIIGWLITSRLRPKAYGLLAVAGGVALGIGYGFRNDLVIYLPPLVVALAAARLRGTSGALRIRVAGIAGFLLVAGALAAPVELGASTGNDSWYHVFQGLSDPFNEALSVHPSFYSWGYIYDDSYNLAQIQDYGQRAQGVRYPLWTDDPALGRAARSLFFAVARDFPADFATRALASTVKVLKLPYPRYGVQFGLGVAAMAFFFGFLRDPRRALFVLSFVTYCSTYPVLQTAFRHYFHLFVLPLVLAAFVLTELTGVGRRAYDLLIRGERFEVRALGPRSPEPPWTPRRLVMAAGLVIAVPLALIVVLSVARSHQHRHVVAMVDDILETPRSAVPMRVSPEQPGFVVLGEPADRPRLLEADSQKPSTVQSTYLMARFALDRCGLDRLVLRVRYESNLDFLTWSIPLEIGQRPKSRGDWTLMIPVHESALSRLAGFELPTAGIGCLELIEQVQSSALPPVLLGLRLPPGWRDIPAYQTLSFELPPLGLVSAR
jgi:hypothetical protein